MTENSVALTDTVCVRVLRRSDAGPLADAYRRNREHLAPWEPLRFEEFFTAEGQAASIESKLGLFIAGTDVPWVLVEGSRIIGVINLSGIVRGPFLSAHLGYWVDKDMTGRGIGSAAVEFALADRAQRTGAAPAAGLNPPAQRRVPADPEAGRL